MKKFVSLLAFLVVSVLSYGQQLTFPGAEGFGKYTSGVRGGKVYIVTNLNDSGPIEEYLDSIVL